MSLVEELAQKMFADVRSSWEGPSDEHPRWRSLTNEARGEWRIAARAALSHLKIDPDAGPVDVGEAVRELKRGGCEFGSCERGAGPKEPVDGLCQGNRPDCFVQKALRALGAPVD